MKLGIVEIEKFAQGHEKIDLMRRVNILALQDSLLSPQATTIDWLAGLVPVNVMDLILR